MVDEVVVAVEEDAVVVVAEQQRPAHLRHLRRPVARRSPYPVLTQLQVDAGVAVRMLPLRQLLHQRRQPQRTHLPLVPVAVVVEEHRAPTAPKAGSNTPRLTSS